MAPNTGLPQELSSFMILTQPSCVTQINRENMAADTQTGTHTHTQTDRLTDSQNMAIDTDIHNLPVSKEAKCFVQ